MIRYYMILYPMGYNVEINRIFVIIETNLTAVQEKKTREISQAMR